MSKDPKELFEDLAAHPEKIPQFVKRELEGEPLDYKSWAVLKRGEDEDKDEKTFSRLVNAIISFASKRPGGLIIIGVDDKKREVQGHKFTQEEISRLTSALRERPDPPLSNCEQQIVAIPGIGEIILLLIIPDGLLHWDRREKRIYIRYGDRSEPAHPTELALKSDYLLYADGLSESAEPRKREIAKKLQERKVEEAAKLAEKVKHSTALEHVALLSTKATALSQEGQFNEALALFQAALKIAESCRDNEAIAASAYNCGVALHNMHRHEDAMSYYNKAVEHCSKYIDAYRNRGSIRADMGDLDGAIEEWTRAVEIDPDYACAYRCRALAHYFKGDFDKAIADWTKLIGITASTAEGYVNRGVALHSKGDLDGAISDYTKAIEINPNIAEAYNNRGNAHKDKGDLDNAIADYTKAVEKDPAFAEAYYHRGNAYQKKGDLDSALADWTRAIEINSTFAEAYYNRGNAHKDKGDLENAIADWTKAIEVNPCYADAYGNRGIAWMLKGNLDNAVKDLEEFLKLAPNHPQAPALKRQIEDLKKKLNK